MRVIRATILAVSLACATPAMADEYFAVTPSGSPEMLFPDHAQTVASTLAGKCIDAHWSVTSSSPTEVVCEAPLNFGQSLVGTLLMGNSYSTPPRRFFKFSISDMNGVSRVQASGWMELQMAFGQMKRTDFSGADFQNGMMNFMGAAGGKPPVGTSYPNHVVLGFESNQVPYQKKIGLLVTKIDEAGAGYAGGLRLGDMVVEVAGKRFKNLGEFVEATAKATKTQEYEIQVVRDGKEIPMKIQRAFRPTATEVVVARQEAGPKVPAVATSSVADELAKLAKLRSDGILSDAEFAAQKAKLLSQ